jgi:hypothetical protein
MKLKVAEVDFQVKDLRDLKDCSTIHLVGGSCVLVGGPNEVMRLSSQRIRNENGRHVCIIYNLIVSGSEGVGT